jgi:hypothetical protein
MQLTVYKTTMELRLRNSACLDVLRENEGLEDSGG